MVLLDKRTIHQHAPMGFARLAHGIHGAFFRKAIAFVRVALNAGKHHILPVGLCAAAAGNNVVNRQLIARKDLAAILAGEIIALINVAPVEFDVMLGNLLHRRSKITSGARRGY